MTAHAHAPGLWLPPGARVAPGGRRLALPDLRGLLGRVERALRLGGLTMMAGHGDATENLILDSIHGDGATNLYTAPVYLALCTATPTDSDTGASLTEANYTGYLRKSLPAADLSAAASGSKTNSAVETFADCTASSAVVQSWATVSAGPARLAAADVILYGTCTSTTIDTTHTPPRVPIGAYVATED